MAENIDIVINDKVDSSIQSKLDTIADSALKGENALTRLQKALSLVNSSPLTILQDAANKCTNAINTNALANQRLATEQERTALAAAKVTTEQGKAALSSQKLATEAQKTALATEKAGAAHEMTATAVQKLATEQARTATATANAGAAQDRAALTALRLKEAQTAAADSTEKHGNSWLRAATAVAAGVAMFAVAEFTLEKFVSTAKDTVLLAARYDTLAVVMDVTGKNSAYTSRQMNDFQASLQATGISAIEARSGLIRMGQAQIDFSNASKLARVAQDAAVVGNINSSEAFNRMMNGLATGQSIVLHHLGLMTNFEQAYVAAASALGKTTAELTNQEKAQIRVNEVLRAGVGIQGAYEAAMNTVGKQLTSLPRYIQDLAVKFGEIGQGPLYTFVSSLTNGLKYVTKHFDEFITYTKYFGSVVVGIFSGLAAQALATWGTTMQVQFALYKMELAAAGVETTAFGTASYLAAGAVDVLKIAIASNPVGLIVTILTTAIGLWMTYAKVQSDALEKQIPKDNQVLAGLREECSLLETKIKLLKENNKLKNVSDPQAQEIDRLKQQEKFIYDQAKNANGQAVAVALTRQQIEATIPKVAKLRSEFNELNKEKIPEKPTQYIDITEEEYKKYSSAFDTLNKQIRDNNPLLDQHENKLADVDREINKLVANAPDYAKELRAQGELVKQNIQFAYDFAKAIRAVSIEMQYQMEIASTENNPFQSNNAGNFNLINDEMLSKVENIQPNANVIKLTDDIRKLKGMLEDSPSDSQRGDIATALKYFNQQLVVAQHTAEDTIDPLNAMNRSIAQQSALLAHVGYEEVVAQHTQALLNQMRQKGISLTEDEIRGMINKLTTLEYEKALHQEVNRVYSETVGRQNALILQEQALNVAYAKGVINLTTLKNSLVQLKIAQANVNLENGKGSFVDVMVASSGRLVSTYKNALTTLSNDFGNFFDKIETGFADSVGHAIVYSDSLGEAFHKVAQEAVAELISSLVKLGIQYAINAAIGTSTATAATTASVAQAAVISTAWATPAAMVSLATEGTNSIGASAALIATTGLAQMLAVPKGFESGGYTGDGGTSQVAGVVHGKEFVVNAHGTARNRDLLEAINRGETVSSKLTTSHRASSGVNVSIHNYGTSKQFQVQQLSETEVRIIAKDEAKQAVYRETPKVVASEIRNPNSTISKSMERNTQTQRRR